MAKQETGWLYHEEQYEGPDSPFPAGVVERGTMSCAHCQAVVILNPQRVRDRHWCWNGDHYICDACSAVLAQTGCLSAAQKIDLAMAHPGRGVSIGSVMPSRDVAQLAADTKPYPGIWTPGKD